MTPASRVRAAAKRIRAEVDALADLTDPLVVLACEKVSGALWELEHAAYELRREARLSHSDRSRKP